MPLCDTGRRLQWLYYRTAWHNGEPQHTRQQQDAHAEALYQYSRHRLTCRKCIDYVQGVTEQERKRRAFGDKLRQEARSAKQEMRERIER